MEVSKVLFKSQEEVDKHLLKMEEFADKVCDMETAIKMLAMIEICYENQEKWFIPAIVIGYEEMALSYIPEDVEIKWVK